MRRIGENANQGIAASARGIELACRYFWEVGLPALEAHFPAYVDRIAAGLIAAGSDCSGNDDEISRDCDWGPRFQAFLTPDDHASISCELQTTLDELPTMYEGSRCCPSGASSNPVHSIDDFFLCHTACGQSGGFTSAPDAPIDWLKIPEPCLFELTHGQVFYDPLGELSDRRQSFAVYYPDDAWKRRLAEALFACGRYGQNVLPRAIARDDYYTSQIAWWRFVDSAMKVGFLLNRRYAPVTKWLYREFCKLPELSVDVVNCLWDGQGELLGRPDLVTRIASAYDEKLERLGVLQSIATSSPQSFKMRAEDVAAGIVDPEIAELAWPADIAAE